MYTYIYIYIHGTEGRVYLTFRNGRFSLIAKCEVHPPLGDFLGHFWCPRAPIVPPGLPFGSHFEDSWWPPGSCWGTGSPKTDIWVQIASIWSFNWVDLGVPGACWWPEREREWCPYTHIYIYIQKHITKSAWSYSEWIQHQWTEAPLFGTFSVHWFRHELLSKLHF